MKWLLLFVVLAGCRATQSAQPSPAPKPVVFGPERGTLVVHLSDSLSRLPLPFGFLRFSRDSVIFQADYGPLRDAPTEYSTYRDVPTGTYNLWIRRLGYDFLDTTVMVRAGQTDTARIRLHQYSGCDICGVVVTKSKHWWQFWRR